MKKIYQSVLSSILKKINEQADSSECEDRLNYQISQLKDDKIVELKKTCSEHQYELTHQNVGWSNNKLSSKVFTLTKIK